MQLPTGRAHVHREIGSIPHEVCVADVVLDEAATQNEHAYTEHNG